MNNFRTLLLIPVFIFQMSGILSNISLGSLLSVEFSGKVCREIKRENLSTKKDSTANRQSAKRVSVITNVLFSGTGNARLF